MDSRNVALNQEELTPGSGAGRESGGIRRIAEVEVSERPIRRRFTAEYKLRILEQADMCTRPGELGALLRREGLYSSSLSTWRRQRREGTLVGLGPKRRGRKGSDPRDERIKRLERENARLRRRLEQAQTVIDVQKKLSEMLGIPLPDQESSEGE
jgi:transposase-like protein